MNANREDAAALKAQGMALIRNRRFGEAAGLFGRICEIDPEDAEAWYTLSSINGMLGKIDEAGECCRRVLALRPDHGEAHLNLGNVLFCQGRHDEAAACYQTALRINPDNAGALCCLGNALAATGRHDEAAANYQAAVRLNPNLVEGYYNLGNSQFAQQKYAEAIDSYQRAIRLKPDYAEAYSNLGDAFKESGEIGLAMENYRHAVRLRPDLASAHNNLAIALKEQGDLQAAEEAARRALQLQPDLVDAHLTLSGIRIAQGRAHEAVGHLEQALKIRPDQPDVHSSLLATMRYLPDYSPLDLMEAAKSWAARHASGEPCLPPPANDPDPRRRLRVGYVSADFNNHPVGCFIDMVLAHHDRSKYEVFCYYNHRKTDGMTARLRQSADHWREVAGESDQELARRIRRDGIDLLFDLSGHTRGSRLLTFALKPAPVQATWLGDPATTGLPAMDYIVADRFVIPPREERCYVERPVRLPNAYECFSPPGFPIEPGPPPALAAGRPTFGCFNNNVKLTETVIACWSNLLRELPEARLYLMYGPYADAGVRRYYQGLFAGHGIEAERIRFSGQAPREQLLSAYREVDIGLDPFPYNGGLTTLEALWMGVPVVSLRGDRFVGRMGETLLTNAGLEECVVDTEDAYTAKAAGLAADLPRLAELRRRLRGRLLDSPLCDGPGFTRDLEGAFRTMWETWCHNQQHDPILRR